MTSVRNNLDHAIMNFSNVLFCDQNLEAKLRIIIIIIRIVAMLAGAYLELTISQHGSKSFNGSTNLIFTGLPYQVTL